MQYSASILRMACDGAGASITTTGIVVVTKRHKLTLYSVCD